MVDPFKYHNEHKWRYWPGVVIAIVAAYVLPRKIAEKIVIWAWRWVWGIEPEEISDRL